jgi:hypothetical protein
MSLRTDVPWEQIRDFWLAGHQKSCPCRSWPDEANCSPLVGPTGGIEIAGLINTGESMRFEIRLDESPQVIVMKASSLRQCFPLEYAQ